MKEHITRLPGDGFDSPPTGDSAHVPYINQERPFYCLASDGPELLPSIESGHVLSGFTNNGIIIADNHGPILFGSHVNGEHYRIIGLHAG